MSEKAKTEENLKLFPLIKVSLIEIQCEDMSRRKKGLQDLYKNLFPVNSPYSVVTYQKAYQECYFQILKCFRDRSEKCREMSIIIMSNFIKELDLNDFYLTYIMPVILERVGTVQIIETSEEIRLEMILFLNLIISKYSKSECLVPFLSDIVQILRQTVLDKYPKAKEASCKCIMDLASALPRHFHLQCDNLVKPVLKSFTHQQHKIRIIAIKVIGIIILHSTSHTTIESTLVPLAERLFDQTALVRQTIAQVSARLLMHYKDRYSYFHRLLPLILTGLCDEIPETRKEVEILWNKVGEQYAKENEKDLKDKLDFPISAPEHYPKGIKRPSLGCRELVQRNSTKIMSAACNELTAWQDDVRVRAAQLICVIVLHCEEHVTQGLQEVLTSIYAACELQREEARPVLDNLMRTAYFVGMFVPVKTWTGLIFPALSDAPTVGHLRILRSVADGTLRENLQGVVKEIAEIVASEPVRCSSRKPQYLLELIETCRVLFNFPEVTSEIFSVLVTVMALCHSRNTKNEITNTMALARELLNRIEEPEKHIVKLLSELKVFRSSISPDRCVLDMLLFNWGKAIVLHLPLLYELLIKALDEECEAEARLTTFEALSTFFESDVLTKMSAAGDIGLEIGKFTTNLIRDVLMVACIWRAGRTAEALRTAAVVCLSCALQHALSDLVAEDDVLDLLLSTLVSLSEDSSWLTRLSSCRCLRGIGPLLKGDEARQRRWANETTVILLKQLDDPNDMVRVQTMTALCDVLQEPNLLEPQNLRHLVDTVMIRVDDQDAETRDASIKILKYVGRSDWTYLNDKLVNEMHLFKNKNLCEDLLKFLTSTQITFVDSDSPRK